MPDISTGNIVQGKTDQVSGCHKNTTLPVYNPGRTGTGWHKGCSLQSPRHYSDATITHVVGIIGGNGDVFSKPGSSSSREMAYGIVSRKVWTAASQQSLRPTGGAAKRALDILVSATALIALFPLMVIISILIAATSKGPVLFWSWRIGHLGKPFHMPKFRTMHVSAPVKSRETLGDACALYTPVGKFLRRSSMDELPQLWSILIGDMSLIGPRPLLMNDPAAHKRLQKPLALQSRPGITGLAQINGRNHLTPHK
ncbi:MAG: hypothetical protein COW58_06495 [Thalassolituus sp. CG17_big_fil_post_rev_8_21_14_2_50_53_8]|nr:MAG: hypothetical protein COW58_06495 [Thalassolituus sp. CG17_big_fil_post_rev_8_21_14_2_50_53_8]